MQFFLLTLTFILVACATKKASEPSFSMAYDSLDENKLQATAIKRKENKGVCIDISLISKSSAHKLAGSWKVAWIDENHRPHEIKQSLRSPAHANVWKNDFTTCESNVKFHQVKELILTTEDEQGPSQKLQLRW